MPQVTRVNMKMQLELNPGISLLSVRGKVTNKPNTLKGRLSLTICADLGAILVRFGAGAGGQRAGADSIQFLHSRRPRSPEWGRTWDYGSPDPTNTEALTCLV